MNKGVDVYKRQEDSYLYREIQNIYNSFARVNAVRVFAKVNAISFCLKAAFTFSIHTKEKMKNF